MTRYIDLLSRLLLVRRLPPFRANVGKRLVKAPKVYVRDSGLVHALLSIGDFGTLSGHPVVGQSWEGFVIENLLAAAPERTLASHYRTAAGAEADLVLDLPNGRRWVVEAKRSLAPTLTKGFRNARRDLAPDRSFLAYPGHERYSRGREVEVVGLRELALKSPEPTPDQTEGSVRLRHLTLRRLDGRDCRHVIEAWAQVRHLVTWSSCKLLTRNGLSD